VGGLVISKIYFIKKLNEHDSDFNVIAPFNSSNQISYDWDYQTVGRDLEGAGSTAIFSRVADFSRIIKNINVSYHNFDRSQRLNINVL
jgi:hypothetical protein